MKLRSISLSNVRRFAGNSACLDGFGDGLNIVAAANEAGKSTFFDALQALFFVPARSGGAEVRALRPYAGGAPEVAAEVELGGARYQIAKRWLTRAFAQVAELPSGRVITRDDEAERWIRDRIAGDGPAELLWVRQGMLALEPEGRTPSEKAEQDRLLSIRRDLLSSVASELAAITGGRRMDAIAAHLRGGARRYRDRHRQAEGWRALAERGGRGRRSARRARPAAGPVRRARRSPGRARRGSGGAGRRRRPRRRPGMGHGFGSGRARRRGRRGPLQQARGRP